MSIVPGITAFGVAGGLGFEPRFPESKSGVLPLDDPPTSHEFTPNGAHACGTEVRCE